MNKSIKFLSLFFLLFLSINLSWAGQGTAYLASLKAQKSLASTGDGLVRLTWLDITGKPFMNPMGVGETGVNATNPVPETGYAETAQMIAATMIAIDGMETPVEIGGSGSQIYMTSMVYFHPEAQPANGSYLADWTFTDAAITRMTEPMGDGSEERPFSSPCFKVLPEAAHSVEIPNSPLQTQEDLAEAMAFQAMLQTITTNPNNIYAVFNKYLLSNPTATSGQLEAEGGNTATLNISFEVEGDVSQFKEYYADFDFPAQSFYEDANGTWRWDFAATPVEFISATKARAHAVVTYTAKSGITAGTHRATLTVRMQGTNPSTLNIALSVDALDPNRPEALLLDGKTEQTSGSLSAMLATDISGYTNPIIKLNKPYGNAIALPSKNFTFDLNGNEVSNDITVSGGEVTIAFSKFGGNAGELEVTGGKAILMGGTFGSLTIGASGTVEQNGATITGAATNYGTLTTTAGTINGGLTSSKTLTLNGGTFKGETAVTVSGGTANINRGDINGTSLGLKVTGGTANVKKLAAITSDGSYSVQRTGGTLNVECGKFGKPLNGTINFTSGFFKDQNYGVSAEGYTEMLISAGVEYNEGYRYFLGSKESAVAAGVPACRIGTVGYAKLEDALAYANNNPGVANIVIFMTNDYTLPAGYYTLPANATIVVPMSDSQEKEINMTAPRVVFNDQNAGTPYTSILPTEFRRLTFASGVNMDVFGDIELTCSQYASNEAYTSQPCGAYGRLVMEEGSHMTLQNGSELRAWGFMTGKGETDARRGSKVREMFQLGDWKGAMTSVQIVGMVKQEDNPQLYSLVGGDHSAKKIFPVSQYFIQNVESPVKYHPGSLLSSSAAVSEGLLGMSVSMAATDIGIVGVSRAKSGGEDDQAIFLMDVAADADNTWVRKWYDVENDIQVYDINSGAHIGSMTLDMGDINLLTYGSVPIRLNSAKFDLPLTCNFKIHLLTGGMDFKQNTSLLPGAEVEVDKEATVSVAMNSTEKAAYDAWVEGGKVGDEPVCYTGALYVYDAAEWDKYAYCKDVDAEGISHESTAYTKTVRYAPSWNGRPTVRAEQTKPASAKINVHGTFQTATGIVYTSASGANIFSSNEDAGTFIFNDDASNAGTRTVYNVKGVGTFKSLTFYPARLRNGDGTYENTDEAEKDLAYCYQNDKWSTMIQDGCFMIENRGGTDIYYAKPQEYVALANGMTANADNTYSDAAGAGRLFILLPGCQWWEVENVDNLYHCIHPDNDTYYYWDDDALDWMEKKYTISWKNWDGTPIETNNGDAEGYEVTYGTMAEFLGSNPTRESNIDYTYDFTGWSPALGPVTSDVTYTATYEQKPRMYTITFNNEGGTLIETQFLTHNATPVCENTPTKPGHILVWDPAISPVIGDQTYTATWLEEPPTEWDVTFVNNANGVLQATAKVGVNEHPTYSGSTPAKENADHTSYSSSEYTYTFWGWSAVIDGVAQQFAAGTELPCPTAPTTYTAVYTEAQATYTITFKNGEETLFEKTDYHYGDMPECPANKIPADESDAQYTYAYAWSPQIQTVMGNQTYQWTSTITTNKYTITLTSNLSGVCSFTGAGTFEYGTNVTNVAVSYDSEKYKFSGWSDGQKDAAHPAFELTGDVTLTANFEVKSLSSLEIAADGLRTLTEATEIKDLIITSDGNTSGQLIGASYLDIKGEAIFRLQQTMNAGEWYAVAVPWQVDIRAGVYAGNRRLNAGSQFYVIDFDATAYAGGSTNTLDYWKFLHQTTNTMLPGKLYMIYLTSARNSLDFHMKKGTSLITVKTSVSLSGGSGGRANWNAIANPALYIADLNTGAENIQKYNGNDSYVVGNTAAMIVGEPMFVQVTTPNTVVAAVHSDPSSAPAYRRAPQAEENAKFVVEIAQNDKMTDRLIVETTDEKADEYVIGQDLAKFGVSSKVAQMWINRYDSKLCVNTIAPEGESANFPISIFAPTAGEYTLHITHYTDDSDYSLYLTYDGQAVWNLSYGAFTAYLSAGTDNHYGLRIAAKAPQTATGVDEAIVDSKDATATKVLINGQVFIIRGEKVYSIDGRLIK